MYMIVNSPCANTNVLYQPVHGRIRCGHLRTNYVDYMQKLTGTKTNKLVETGDITRWRGRA